MKAKESTKQPNTKQTEKDLNKINPSPSNADINKKSSTNTVLEFLSFGYGKFEFQNKIVYIGSYKTTSNGKYRHGKGKVIHPTPDNLNLGKETYEGDWVDDKMHGYGIYHYPNGDIYEGEFVNNKHHGYGKYYFTDGSRYEGDWFDHKMHGTGNYWDISNILWSGEFRNGEYMSKEQARLKEDKRIEKKINKLKVYFKEFLLLWDKVYTASNKKNIKENMKKFFPNKNQMGAYIESPYPKLEDKTYSDWNSIFTTLIENYSSLEIKVPKSIQDLTIVNKSRVKANQLQDELSSGQLIEVIYNFGENDQESYRIAIAYIKEFESWFLVYFKHKKVVINEVKKEEEEIVDKKEDKEAKERSKSKKK